MKPQLALMSIISLLAVSPALAANAREQRITVDDYFRMGQVSEAQVSPEGDWIAFTVTRQDLDEDTSISRVWMVPAAGGEAIAMTGAGLSSWQPRWSPDGRFLAFLSERSDGETQVWTLRRVGGEAEQLTDAPQSVRDYAWSPDSKRLVLVMQDPTPEQLAAFDEGDAYVPKTPGPWVIDRELFKADYVGYLDRRRTHLYLQDVAGGQTVQLTGGDYDDDQPAWSPDGKRIAFASNRSEDPDLNYNTDIWVVKAEPQADGFPPLKQVTTNPGSDDSPAWSPDGLSIAHTSVIRPETHLYATQHLAISSAAGGDTRVLTTQLDRMIFQPRFAPNGRTVWFLLEDHGEQNLARMPVAGGAVERLVRGQDVVRSYDFGPGGEVGVVVSRPDLPEEVFLLKDGKLAQRSHTNAELFRNIRLAKVVKVQLKSSDGTPVEGFVYQPPGFEQGHRYPTLLNIHGGPQSQYDAGFFFEAQLLAANGYLVVAPNPRGSTGYGMDFCLAIWQDWGGPDYLDVMAAVDDAIARGWADPDRLGVMGWSYGGILTNHVLTKTHRFKAAASGAGEFLYVVNYGHDQYLRWWEQELGQPWKPEARKLWERLSPFNEAEKITTPTLVLGGKEDWNVPIINGEQLYLTLKRLGVETELVVYPDESHGIDTPSHTRDLYQRYLDWFGSRL